MADYTVSPVTELGTDAAGTSTAEIAEIGRKHHISEDDRLPAFVGLAKATGGFYAENEDGLTLDKLLVAAQMNFEVEFEDKIETWSKRNGQQICTKYPFRGTRAFWDGSNDPVGMGMVKSRYQLVQPRAAGELGQAFMGESGANAIAGGIYGDPRGSKTYLAFKLPEGLTIGGEDRHDLYMTILNSYNGTTGLTGLFAPIRIACTNMTTITFGKRVSNRFTFRHSGDIEKKKLDALEALGVAQEWTAEWKRKAEVLLMRSMTGKDLDRYLEKALPTPARDTRTSASEQRWMRKRLEIKQIITESDTCEFGRGTAYAALQGVHEWADWRSATKQSGSVGTVARFVRTLDGGPTEKIKLDAANLLLAG